MSVVKGKTPIIHLRTKSRMCVCVRVHRQNGYYEGTNQGTQAWQQLSGIEHLYAVCERMIEDHRARRHLGGMPHSIA